jgi:hypothetical protein
MMHLSRVSEELVLWLSAQFNFITLSNLLLVQLPILFIKTIGKKM